MHSYTRTVLLIAASVASFLVGCLAGFLLSSYGEELNTIGKLRDWLIGGITGITIIKAAAIKSFLLTFCMSPEPIEYALIASMAIVYGSLGFFFMYFQRELILNLLLARTRAERGRLEGTKQTGLVIRSIGNELPASLLTGVDDAKEVVSDDEEKRLRSLLYSPDVQTFLDEAEQSTKEGCSLEWDVVSKVAYVHYYRTYFEQNGNKDEEIREATEWISRALTMNPMHVDLTIKYADVLGMAAQYDAAVAVLHNLSLRPDAPLLVKQWLGYFLLFIPGREQQAIEYSTDYLRSFPNDADAKFNLACAYAQLYQRDLQAGQANGENRRQSLFWLAEALKLDPEYTDAVRTKWIKKGESFEAFAADPEFLSLVASTQVPLAPAVPAG